ncbi:MULTISPECIES: excalibur calcium-binding domain-containing protein [unclassified Arthrobacter]|uniref:excalibur calcium-binding domain-containing protein n=1 Tax=unclassified Arthrobacter TaxID=235627 RepID=UPI001F0E3145|nr:MULTISPECIES: excalibur calcium-binding domain-containing protein [unclassified Arthrobacter]
MTNYPNHPYAPARPQQRWKATVLFWIVAALLLLVLIPFAIAGGFGMVLFILGLVALLTGLYVFLFKRRSWVGLPHRKSGGLVAIAGFVALILGAGVVGATAAPRADTDKAAQVSPVQQSATATPTPTPTATNPANSTCTTAAGTRQYNNQTFICTAGSDQRLVWMSEADSKRVLAEKAAAEKLAAEKAAAETAAAEKAATEQAAAEKAAADKAAADQAAAQLAAEQAAAQKAAEAAAAQAAQQAAKPAPAPAPAAPAPSSVYYANCAAAKAAGAAPLYRGQPGYRTGMDGDNDGVACER